MRRCGSLIRRSRSRFDRLLALPFFRESLCGLAAETPIRKPFDFASERIGSPVFRMAGSAESDLQKWHVKNPNPRER